MPENNTQQCFLKIKRIESVTKYIASIGTRKDLQKFKIFEKQFNEWCKVTHTNNSALYPNQYILVRTHSEHNTWKRAKVTDMQRDTINAFLIDEGLNLKFGFNCVVTDLPNYYHDHKPNAVLCYLKGGDELVTITDDLLQYSRKRIEEEENLLQLASFNTCNSFACTEIFEKYEVEPVLSMRVNGEIKTVSLLEDLKSFKSKNTIQKTLATQLNIDAEDMSSNDENYQIVYKYNGKTLHYLNLDAQVQTIEVNTPNKKTKTIHFEQEKNLTGQMYQISLKCDDIDYPMDRGEFIYSDDTVSTGYKTNSKFNPNLNDLKRIMYGNSYTEKQINQPNCQHYDINTTNTIYTILSNSTGCTTDKKSMKLIKMYKYNPEYAQLIIKCILTEIEKVRNFVDEGMNIISTLEKNSTIFENSGLIKYLESLQKTCLQDNLYEIDEQAIRSLGVLLGRLYIKSFAYTDIYCLQEARNFIVTLINNMVGIEPHQEVPEINHKANLMCTLVVLKECIYEIKVNDHNLLDTILKKTKCLSQNDKRHSIRKAANEIVHFYADSYVKYQEKKVVSQTKSLNKISTSKPSYEKVEFNTNIYNINVDQHNTQLCTAAELEVMQLFKKQI